jgi:hypothetical protein
MAGTIITDRIESDSSYASRVEIASPVLVTNTFGIKSTGGTGNFNFVGANTNTDRTFTLPDNAGDILTDESQLDASNITGQINVANLGTGTASNTTFLRGDGSWQAISTTPTTAQVLDATAGATEGAVGTYSTASSTVSGTLNVGSTTSGSNLRGQDGFAGSVIAFPFSGTWRNMGPRQLYDQGNNSSHNAVLRIA